MASLHGNRKLRHLGLAELPEITDDGVKVCERDSMGAHSDNVYKELRNVLYWVSSTPLHLAPEDVSGFAVAGDTGPE